MKNIIKSALTTIISATLLLAPLCAQDTIHLADAQFKSWDVKNATYYSIDDDGKIIDFKTIESDFFMDDFVVIESRTGDEFYSHLNIHLRDGKIISYSIVGGKSSLSK